MLNNTRRFLSSAQTKDFENNIKWYAQLLHDEEMEFNITNIGFIEKEVDYHAVCRSMYQRQAESSAATEDHNLGLDTDVHQTDWHRSREVHADAFAIVCDFIEQSILNKKRSS